MMKPSYEELVCKQKAMQAVVDAARRARDVYSGLIHLLGSADSVEKAIYLDLNSALTAYEERYDHLGRPKLQGGASNASTDEQTEVLKGNVGDTESIIPPIG